MRVKDNMQNSMYYINPFIMFIKTSNTKFSVRFRIVFALGVRRLPGGAHERASKMLIMFCFLN